MSRSVSCEAMARVVKLPETGALVVAAHTSRTVAAAPAGSPAAAHVNEKDTLAVPGLFGL